MGQGTHRLVEEVHGNAADEVEDGHRDDPGIRSSRFCHSSHPKIRFRHPSHPKIKYCYIPIYFFT
jgi:hypothetical protein